MSKSFLTWEVVDAFASFYLPRKHTTRGRRPGEDDREYHFASIGEFTRLSEQGEFLLETEIYGNRYALTRSEAAKAMGGERDAILVLDAFLAQRAREVLDDVILCYVMPTDPEALADRIRDRSSAFLEDPTPRIGLLAEELEQAAYFDYVLPMTNSEVAYQILRHILIAESCRPARFRPELDPDRSLIVRDFPRLAVDLVVLQSNQSHVLLVDRHREPLGWALPGGFVEYGETVEAAARRECREETGVEPLTMRLVGVFSDAERDPRMHVASVAFLATVDAVPTPGSDARSAAWYPIAALPRPLAFDHDEIVTAAISLLDD